MNIKGVENIGKTLPPVTDALLSVGGGQFRITFRNADGAPPVAETWDIEEPERLFLTPAGGLVYIDNHGAIGEVIGPASFLRLERLS